MTCDQLGGFPTLRDRVQALMAERLPEHLARLRLDRAALAARQRDGLRELLRTARARSPFHARRLAAVDVERFELGDLESLPVMTKADLMQHFDDVLTDRRVTRALCEAALRATRDEPQAMFGELTCLASGGSSGQRGVFVLDAHAQAEFMASLNRRTMERLLAQGGPPPGGLRIAMVGAASAVHATGSAPAWTAGGPATILAVPVTLPLAAIVERLDALDAPALYGYPSMLVRLAREKAAGRLRIAPLAISSSSETLLPEWRAAIEEAFGVPVTDVFGSSEGLVGVGEPGDPTLVFNSDVCIVELVDERNRPVPPGVPSSKILLTNLANHVQPLVRYEIGDQFVRAPDAPEHGHVRATVVGRNEDMLRWGTTEVHPLVVRGVLVKQPGVTDYQVRQTERGIEIAVLTSETVDLERLATGLRAALAAAGLDAPEVAARACSALERHPETGKVRRFLAL
jgi:phenylacetate-coenzyme A ligase PaaK-like adenylate-forming protein